MFSNWTIENDPPPNNATGDSLDGLTITQVSPSDGYVLTNSEGTRLSSSGATSPPFSFDKVAFAGATWNLHITKLPVDGEGKGKWHQVHTGPKRTGGQDGDFTAMAGSGPKPIQVKDPDAPKGY